MANTVTVKVSEKSTKQAITIEVVEDLFNEVLMDHGLRKSGNRVEAYDHRISYEVERGFGINCRIYYRNDFVLDLEEYRRLSELNPDLRIARNNPVVELGWSSTSRSVSEALSAIDLYERMTKAAADFENRLNEWEYIIE